MREFTVFGHRGAAGHEPENTLRSISKALELGAKWIEIDVYTVEGELVVIHDDRLERTTDGTGYVEQCELTYLRSLNAGKGEKIPYLAEVLDLIGDKAGLNIELKGRNTAESTVGIIKLYVNERGWKQDRFLVSSFDHPELMRFRELMPEIKTGALIAHIPLDYSRFAIEMGVSSIHASLEFLSEEFVRDVHNQGLKFYVYTVNHPDDIRRVMDFGVDGFYTDFPERGILISN